MINLSIVQGDFPDGMKLSKVFPIYKSENEQLVKIIDLSQFCRTFLKFRKESFIIILLIT